MTCEKAPRKLTAKEAEAQPAIRQSPCETSRGGVSMRAENKMFQPSGLLWGIVTLIFGILVLVFPQFLRYTVGIYLIIVGLWAIFPRLRL